MSVAAALKRVYDSSPASIRRISGKGLAWLPPGVLYGGAFRRTARLLRQSEGWSSERRAEYQNARLDHILNLARHRVPHYRDLFSKLANNKGSADPLATLQSLPLLTRDDVRALGTKLLPEGIPTNSYKYSSTAGTSGRPLGFYITHAASGAEWAFILHAWSRHGFKWGDRRAILRGHVIKNRHRGHLIEEDPLNRALMLSSFDLNERHLHDYVAAIRTYRPAYLHAYPSSAQIFAQYLAQTGQRLTSLKGLLLGSENLYPSQRAYLERVFECPVVSWYGHSEKCILAVECEARDGYHVLPEYGVVEIVDSNGNVITQPRQRGQLVGTGFISEATIFLRYLTDDEAEWDLDPCPCGRPGHRIRNVTGRWNQELLVGRSGALISMAALNLHHSAYTRMQQFQFEQVRAGVALLRIVKGSKYASDDERALKLEFDKKLGGEIDVTIQYVAAIPSATSGKFKFIDQRISLDYRRWSTG